MAAIRKIQTSNRISKLSESNPANNGYVRASEFNEVVDRLNSITVDNGVINVSGDITVDDITADDITADDITADTMTLSANGINATALGNVAGSGQEFTVLTTLTATEIVGTAAGDLGHASGATLVAAPGAGFALQFIRAIAIYDFATAAYTGGGDDTSIRLGSGGAAITGIVTSANLLGAAGDKIVRFEPLAAAALPVSVNVAISLVSTTAWTQPGTAAGVLRVYTTYRVITTGL